MLGDDPRIGAGCEIVESRFGRFVEIGQGTRLDRVSFGDYAYCDRMCDIAHAEIGKFANIASFVRVGPTDHPMERASQHHFQYRSAKYWPEASDDAAFFAARRARHTVIGIDSWLGHNAIILPEVTIGIGAVVAAGAVVTRDVAPFAVVVGVPARQVKTRFPEPIIARLMALAWWDWDHDRLGAALPAFRALSIEAFLERFGA